MSPPGGLHGYHHLHYAQRADHDLHREHHLGPEAAELVRAALVRDGVEVLTGHRAVAVQGTPGGPGTITVDDGSGTKEVGYDVLLVAVGRSPRSAGLGLDAAASNSTVS